MRYERKYRVETVKPEWVDQVIRLHPAGFRSLYPDRQINNIYFDTPDFRAFNENVAGVAQRRKYRLRWYGAAWENLRRPVLEIKIKESELGYKESYPLSDTSWQDLPELFAKLPLLHDRQLRPVLVNAYHRSYFGTTNGRFRLTIDHAQRFAPYRENRPYLRPFPVSDVIVELKYEAGDEALAPRIWQHLPFRQTKNSKYVSGLQLIMG